MRVRTFDWSAGTAASGPGWLVQNPGNGFYPGAGFLTAHDVMDHLSSKTDWAHELRATGAALFSFDGVPGRSLATIAFDIVGFAGYDHEFEVPPAPARWHKPLPFKHEQRLRDFAVVLNDEISNPSEYGQLTARAKAMARTFVERAMPWIRLGYRGAMRVYGADKGQSTGWLMEHLKDAINLDHDITPPVKGDTLTVSLDTKRGTFTLRRGGNKHVSHNTAHGR